MNITDLVNRELKESEDKFGKEDTIVSLLRKSLTLFGYKVLKEISRLNFPAFTYTEDNDLTKQGFCNMVLHYLYFWYFYIYCVFVWNLFINFIRCKN